MHDNLSLDEWIAREAIPFAPDADAAFGAVVDSVMQRLGAVEVLGLGETMHGSAGLLQLRNRLFQHLAKTHGFSAIAVESSFPRGRVANDFVHGRGPDDYDAVQAAGFSHGFGALEANRELLTWMRQHNAEAAPEARLSFYGFDSPTEMMTTDSPRQVLYFVLDYLAVVDEPGARAYRERMEALLGDDAAWETEAAAMDPSKGVGLTPQAAALRIATEDLLADLSRLRPELIERTSLAAYHEAEHYGRVARQLLAYHAGVASQSGERVAKLLGQRDAAMADNVLYIARRERGRLLVFAHNSHVQRGRAEWRLANIHNVWWPAGAHLAALLGPRYAVIGTAVGASEAHGIGQPEPGTLEARLGAVPGPALFIPTHLGQGLDAAEVASLPTRTGSTQNPGYFPLTARSLRDFDWLAALRFVQ